MQLKAYILLMVIKMSWLKSLKEYMKTVWPIIMQL